MLQQTKVRRNLSSRVYKVAQKNNLSYALVEKIVTDFLETFDESAFNGERLVFNGYTSIDVILGEEPTDVVVRGRVSETLKERIIQNRLRKAGLDAKED